MKKQILFIAFTFFSLVTFAQKPEPIYSFATVPKTISYYKEQATLWKKEIDKNKQNALAWYNYYRAYRNVLGKDTADHRTWKTKVQSQFDLVNEMEKAIPNTFEFNMCKWAVNFNDFSQVKYLKAAAELGKDRPEIVSDMINLGEIERDIEMRNEYSKRWYESDLASPGLLNYNYNVLIGLKQNAILLTCGDNDTYPIWQLQSQGIRKDVTMLNLSLLGIDEYRDKIFKELYIQKWDTSQIEKSDKQKENGNFYSLVKHIAKHNGNHPVYVGLTVESDYTKSMEDSFYLTGMAYEYSSSVVDNMALLKNNFEHLYSLDYIDKHFYKDVSAYFSECVNQNYIVPMAKLYSHYKTSGETQKAEWIKEKIHNIVKGTEYEKEAMEYINKN